MGITSHDLLFAAAAPSNPTSGDPSAPEGTAEAGLPDAAPRSSAVAGAFAGLLFGAALLAALFFGHVPPWAAWGAIGMAGLALIVRDPSLRAGLVAVGAAPLLLPALAADRPGEGGWPVWLALSAAAGLGVAEKPRRAALAGIALAFGIVAALKQGVAIPLLPAAAGGVAQALVIGWLASALSAGAPTGRSGAAALLGAGLLVGASGLSLADRARTERVERVALEVSDRRAADLWPVLEARAAEEIDRGRIVGALALLRAAPDRPSTGQLLFRRWGSDLVLDAGWDPRGAVAPDVAVALALALDARGEGSRAVELLRHQPRRGEVAFWLALLARETALPAIAADAWPRATVPDGVPRDPTALIEDQEWVTNHAIDVLFVLDTPATALEITGHGDAWEGPPEVTLRIAGQAWGPTGLPTTQTTWRWDVPLPAGAYRLQARYGNDAQADGGDRNVLGFTVRLAR